MPVISNDHFASGFLWKEYIQNSEKIIFFDRDLSKDTIFHKISYDKSRVGSSIDIFQNIKIPVLVLNLTRIFHEERG